MSRLDSFIRRMMAQKLCLEHCAGLIDRVQGPVVELGLGNGRTFDHLREILPEREIFVVERDPRAHADSTPDPSHLIVGDLADCLPDVPDHLPATVALLHSDIGCGDARIDETTAQLVADNLNGLMAEGGIVLSDQKMEHRCLRPRPLPTGVAPGRYYIYDWRP